MIESLWEDLVQLDSDIKKQSGDRILFQQDGKVLSKFIGLEDIRTM